MLDKVSKMFFRVFGKPKPSHIRAAQEARFHRDTFFQAIMDGESLLDQATLDVLVQEFPKDLIEEADLYLIIAECIANAALHGEAKVLGFHARRRRKILLLSFFQIPPMPRFIVTVLSLARTGALPDYDCDLPGGLGFPILLRLAHRVTTSSDRTRLQLWLRLNRP
jgi:hypothetical protein